jgi:ubiquinone/menaquinone biosynthesis C-methylase UbiE
MTGIDLVDFFNTRVSAHANVKPLVGNLLEVEFQERFDLITRVHGMHYVADKLEAIFRYAAILKPGGRNRCLLLRSLTATLIEYRNRLLLTKRPLRLPSSPPINTGTGVSSVQSTGD